MDNLQYENLIKDLLISRMVSFKPYYKWITFNTSMQEYLAKVNERVLNLIING